MPFQTSLTNEMRGTGAGERHGNNNTIIPQDDFEDGLKTGLFVKFDNNQVENIDGSTTPLVIGVAERNVANAIEDTGALDASVQSHVNIIYNGSASVTVVDGQTPSPFNPVFVSNEGNADDGKAHASTGEVTDWIFVRPTNEPNVWIVVK